MTPAARELFRQNLLQQLAAISPGTLPVPALKVGLAIGGFERPTDEAIQAELQYLIDKGLVARPPALISPENGRWRITAAGADYLAERGLG